MIRDYPASPLCDNTAISLKPPHDRYSRHRELFWAIKFTKLLWLVAAVRKSVAKIEESKDTPETSSDCFRPAETFDLGFGIAQLRKNALGMFSERRRCCPYRTGRVGQLNRKAQLWNTTFYRMFYTLQHGAMLHLRILEGFCHVIHCSEGDID